MAKTLGLAINQTYRNEFRLPPDTEYIQKNRKNRTVPMVYAVGTSAT
jgi:hypothetical protein